MTERLNSDEEYRASILARSKEEEGTFGELDAFLSTPEASTLSPQAKNQIQRWIAEARDSARQIAQHIGDYRRGIEL